MRASALCLFAMACAPPASDERSARVLLSERPCRLSGTIVDGEGRTRPSAWAGVGAPGAGVPDATITEEGGFAIESPPGDVQLFAFDDELGMAKVEITVAPGEDLADLVVVLGPPPPNESLQGDYDDSAPFEPDLPEEEDFGRPPEREVTLQIVDETGQPIDLQGIGLRLSTHYLNKKGNGEQWFSKITPESSAREFALQLLGDEPSEICADLAGFLDDECLWARPGEDRLLARFRRGSIVKGTVRRVSEGTRVACGGKDGLTTERGYFEATCPADATLEIGESMRVPLPTRIGHTLYVEVRP